MSYLSYVLYWIGKLTGTIIIVPHPIAVGNCGEELYYGLMKARKEGKKLVVLYPFELPWLLRLRIPNRELLRVESEYRTFSSSNPLHTLCCWLITLYYGFFRGISIVTNRYFKYRLPERHVIPMIGQELLWMQKPVMPAFSWNYVEFCEWAQQARQPLEIFLSKKSRPIALEKRRSMGLPDDAWFVCVHVRDGGYYGDHTTVERNANIENYIPAIREITRRGGWVVRMGDASMKKLPPMERVIDYPFTPEKSEMMDVYLIKECSVYMGMQSGILELACMFRRPIILANMYSWLLGHPQQRIDLGILRPVYSKVLQRYLLPMEWPLLPWGSQTFAPLEDYTFGENSPDDLVEVVKEFFDRGPNWVPSAEQLAYNALRHCKAHEVLANPLPQHTKYDDMIGRYRLAARFETAEGMLGAAFLKKYAAVPENTDVEVA